MDDDDAFAPKEGYGQEIFSGLTRKVIRLDEQRVVKRGSLKRREVDTLEFIAANTTIPAPKVHQTRFHKPGETSEIIMDNMPGETLESVWLTLSHDCKVSICKQLGGYLAQLKSLKGKRIEGVNGTKQAIPQQQWKSCGLRNRPAARCIVAPSPVSRYSFNASAGYSVT